MLGILLTLIFARPFISSLAFPCANASYSMLFLGILAAWIIKNGLVLEKMRPLRIPLSLFLAAIIISSVFSYNKIVTLQESYKYLTAILLLLIIPLLSQKVKEKILSCIVGACVVIAFLCIYQYFFGFQHISNYIAKHGLSGTFTLDYISRRRVYFPFVTPDILAGYLAMVIPISLNYKNKFWLILLFGFALLLTQSLGGILSLLAALAIYFGLEGKLKQRGILLLLFLLAVLVIVFILRSQASQKHLQPIFSSIMRLGYWQDALQIIKTHPLTGVGIGNFSLVQSRYAHNSYLQIWAEMGILGIVSILGLVIAVIKNALRNKDPRVAIIIAANAAFLLHNLIDFSFFLPEVSLIWWVLLGLLIA